MPCQISNSEKCMKKLLRNFLILIFPIALIILVNEYSRFQLETTDYQSRGHSTINSASRNPEKCTWACYNDTGYCKTHHVKLNQAYFFFTGPLYFGMIAALKGIGNYGLANILLLVLFFPVLIYTMLIKSLNIQDRIS